MKDRIMPNNQHTDLTTASTMSMENYLKPRFTAFDIQYNEQYDLITQHLHLERTESGGGEVNVTHPNARHISQLPHVQRARATARGIRRK